MTERGQDILTSFNEYARHAGLEVTDITFSHVAIAYRTLVSRRYQSRNFPSIYRQ